MILSHQSIIVDTNGKHITNLFDWCENNIKNRRYWDWKIININEDLRDGSKIFKPIRRNLPDFEHSIITITFTFKRIEHKMLFDLTWNNYDRVG